MKQANLPIRSLALLLAASSAMFAAPVGAATPDPTWPAGAAIPPPPPMPAAETQTPGAPPPSVPAPQASAPANAPAAAAADDPLSALAWLRGCWQGKVNQREFREMWLAPMGGVMLGASHTVLQGKTSDHEFMRIEQRPDAGIVYSLAVPEQKEVAYKLSAPSGEEFAFVNAGVEFPSKIVYRPGSEGWLYARVEGKVKGENKQVIYPMRHVDCMSGDFILK
jgi:hypothetical protein